MLLETNTEKTPELTLGFFLSKINSVKNYSGILKNTGIILLIYITINLNFVDIFLYFDIIIKEIRNLQYNYIF